MRVAVLMPSKGRASQLLSRAADLMGQEYPKGVKLRLYVGAVEDDHTTRIVLAKLAEDFDNLRVVGRPADSNAVDGWMRAYREATKWGASWYVLGADDILWREGWLTEALRVARLSMAHVVGLNDGHTNLAEYAPHYMASRKFCELYMGGRFIPEGYQCWWFDRHVCQLAISRGLYAPAWDAHAEHRHPDWRTAPMDDTYAEAMSARDEDKAVYLAWWEGMKAHAS